MPQPSRRAVRGIAAAALLTLSPSLAACGFSPQTNQIYQPAVGTNFRSSQVDVLGAVVVTAEGGSDEGRLIASFLNNENDSEDAVTAIAGAGEDAAAQVDLTEPIELVPNDLVNVAETEPLLVSGVELVPGQLVNLRYTFEKAEAVTFQAVVVSDGEETPYADLGPDSGANAVEVELPIEEGEVGSGGDLGTAPSDEG